MILCCLQFVGMLVMNMHFFPDCKSRVKKKHDHKSVGFQTFAGETVISHIDIKQLLKNLRKKLRSLATSARRSIAACGSCYEYEL